jgi:sulfonate transport system substrate-binding protein
MKFPRRQFLHLATGGLARSQRASKKSEIQTHGRIEMSRIKRRLISVAALASVAILFAVGSHAVAQEKVVRIGHQTLGAYTLLKQQGALERRLRPLGYSITWTQFPGGPQLLDGLKMGTVDLAHAGEAPPIFAQADGAPLVYIGHEPSSPKTEAIIVPKDSALKTIVDLKGKKVALNRGSNVHYLLVRVLEKAGLKYTDVELVFLPPAGGREAFENRSIDAWAIWEPYRAAAEMSLGARTLVDGNGVVSNHEFFFAAKPFAEAKPQIVDIVLGATRELYAEVVKDLSGTAKIFSAASGFPVPVLETALSRRSFGVEPMSDSVIAEQQNIADTFKSLGLIPAAINVSDAMRKARS